MSSTDFRTRAFRAVQVVPPSLSRTGLGSLDRAVTLHQIEAFERHIEARIVRVAQAHELAARAAIFNLVQSLELADAVIHVNDVIPGLELGKIAEKTRRLGPPPRRRARGHRFKQISGPVDRQVSVGKNDAIGERRAAQHNRGNAAGRGVLRQARAGGVFFNLSQAVRNLIFMAKIDVPLEFARDSRPPAGRARPRRCVRALRP